MRPNHVPPDRVRLSPPPTLAGLGVEAAVVGEHASRTGLVIVSGEAGGGRSTLLAAMTRAMLDNPWRHAAVREYGEWIRFDHQHACAASSFVVQSQIPRDLPSFAAAIHNARLCFATKVVVDPCRDPETIEAVVDAVSDPTADRSIHTTMDGDGVAATLRSALGLLDAVPDRRRGELATAFLRSLRLVVSQRLVPAAHGGRTALREYLVFDSLLLGLFLGAHPERWPGLAQDIIDHGYQAQSLEVAVRRALADGRVTEAVANAQLQGGHAP